MKHGTEKTVLLTAADGKSGKDRAGTQEASAKAVNSQSVKVERQESESAAGRGDDPNVCQPKAVEAPRAAAAAAPSEVEHRNAHQHSQPQKSQPRFMQEQQQQHNQPTHLNREVQRLQRQHQRMQILQPKRTLQDSRIIWMLHESISGPVKSFLRETLSAAGATVGTHLPNTQDLASGFRCEVPLVYFIFGLRYLQVGAGLRSRCAC